MLRGLLQQLIIRSLIFNCKKSYFRIANLGTKISTVLSTRSFSTPTKAPERQNFNEPIRFAGSPAASLMAKQSRSGTVDYESVPWFQVYVVVGSVAIFLVYFCILREENDIDEEMGKSLYERIPGLEQTQLIISYKYNRENNIDNGAIIERMKELGMDPKDISL